MSLIIELDNDDIGFAQIMYALSDKLSCDTTELWQIFFKNLRIAALGKGAETIYKIKQKFIVSGEPSDNQKAFEAGYRTGELDCRADVVDGQYTKSLALIRRNYMQSKISHTFCRKNILRCEFNPNLGKSVIPAKGIYKYLIESEADYSFLENWTFKDLDKIPACVDFYINKLAGDFDPIYFRFGFLCGIRRSYCLELVDISFYADLKDLFATYCEQDVGYRYPTCAMYYVGDLADNNLDLMKLTSCDFDIKFPHLNYTYNFSYRNTHRSAEETEFVKFLKFMKNVFIACFEQRQRVNDDLILFLPENDLQSVLAAQLFDV